MNNIISISLDGRVPSKKNSKRILKNKRTGKHFISSSTDHKTWHRFALLRVKSICEARDITKCYIKIHMTFGDKYHADLTNKAESLMDLLVDAGIIVDDNFLVVNDLHLTGSYEKGVYRSKIFINDMSERS